MPLKNLPLLPWLRALFVLAIGATLSLSIRAQSPPSEWTSTTAGWTTGSGTCSICHGTTGLNLGSMPTIGSVPANSLGSFLTWFNMNGFSGENSTMSSFYASSNTTSQTDIWQYLVNVRDGSISTNAVTLNVNPSQTQPFSITVTNYRLNSVDIPAPTGWSGTNFKFLTSTCGMTILAQATCDLNFEYDAPAIGGATETATLSIGPLQHTGSDPDGVTTFSVALTANVRAPIATLSGTGTLNFSANVGSSATASAVIGNTGNYQLILQGFPFGAAPGNSAPGDYALDSTNTCTTTPIPAGGSCNLVIAFTPGALGARDATLSIADNTASSPIRIILNGSGTAAPVGFLALSQSSVGLPDTVLGTTSYASPPLTVQNTGNAAVTFSGITVSGADAADFVTGGSCSTSSPLPAGGNCTVSIAFTPAAVAPPPRTASLSLQSNASNASVSVALSGKGLAVPVAVASLAPPSLDFGPQTVGGLYPASTITLTNTGNAALAVSLLSVVGAGFAIVDTQSCAASLAPQATCTIGITFAPSAAGPPTTGSLTITSNANNSPTQLALSGQGTTAAVPVLAWSPAQTSLAFGQVTAGTISTAQSLTLTNQGPGGATINLVNAVGSGSQAFAISTPDCASGQVVYQGQTCTFNVTFAPSVAGTQTASVQIASTGSPPGLVALTGTGLGAANVSLSLSSTSLDFGTVQAGTASQPRTVSLSNSGAGTLQVSEIDVSGPYTMQSATCPQTPFTLAAGTDCAVTVSFNPASGTTGTGTLSIKSQDLAAPAIVTLSGQGSAAPDLSSGGCSIGGSDGTVDPTLWTLAALAIAALGYRARQRRRDERQQAEEVS